MDRGKAKVAADACFKLWEQLPEEAVHVRERLVDMHQKLLAEANRPQLTKWQAIVKLPWLAIRYFLLCRRLADTWQVSTDLSIRDRKERAKDFDDRASGTPLGHERAKMCAEFEAIREAFE